MTLDARRLLTGIGLCAMLPLMAFACSSSSEDSKVASNTGGSGAASSGGSGGSSAAGGNGGSSASSGSGGGIALGGAGGGSGGKNGCSKTDFLFVVDSSVSMGQEQTALTAAFPKFISSITGATNIKQFHILVTDTDATTRCTASACAGTPHSTCNNYACNHVYTGCDATWGAGVIQPTGQGSSNTICPVAGGIRWMDENQPNLSDTFSCVATLGLAGNPSEQPITAMQAAVSPQLEGPGGCNEGFLRDDAILVVTFISDDPNKEDPGQPQEWFNTMVASKGGNAEAIVMLGLIPDGASPTPAKQLHWHEFISLFGKRGIKGDVGAADYAPFFDSAIAIIDETCDNFVPPS